MKPIVAIVPARGGSVELPHKNLRLCAGKPLTDWTLEAAQQATSLDAVILSSDDPEIRALGDKYPKVISREREAALSTSTTSTEAVLASILDETTAWEIGVLLQPTSPIRTAQQIDEAVLLLQSAGVDSVVSVVRNHSFLWEIRSGYATPLYDPLYRPRRQEMSLFRENGSIYVFTRESWERCHNRIGGRTVLYAMPPECGYEVDDETDLFIAEKLLEHRAALLRH